MDLSGLPQFTVSEIRQGPAPDVTLIVGRLSHLRGVHNDRGWLYRGEHKSVIADLGVASSAALYCRSHVGGWLASAYTDGAIGIHALVFRRWTIIFGVKPIATSCDR